MARYVNETVVSINCKIRPLLSVRSFYTDHDLVNLYKAHILSFIEYRTPALFHASSSVLFPLDMVQTRFLRELEINIEDAAIYMKLLPLRVRRQISMLGVIQRAILRRGPSQFWQWF